MKTMFFLFVGLLVSGSVFAVDASVAPRTLQNGAEALRLIGSSVGAQDVKSALKAGFTSGQATSIAAALKKINAARGASAPALDFEAMAVAADAKGLSVDAVLADLSLRAGGKQGNSALDQYFVVASSNVNTDLPKVGPTAKTELGDPVLAVSSKINAAHPEDKALLQQTLKAAKELNAVALAKVTVINKLLSSAPETSAQLCGDLDNTTCRTEREAHAVRLGLTGYPATFGEAIHDGFQSEQKEITGNQFVSSSFALLGPVLHANAQLPGPLHTCYSGQNPTGSK